MYCIKLPRVIIFKAKIMNVVLRGCFKYLLNNHVFAFKDMNIILQKSN